MKKTEAKGEAAVVVEPGGVCNGDCFHCIHPDCINDRITHQANKEYQRSYYEANKKRIAEYQRSYYKANKERLAESQKCIRETRQARGYTQSAFAKILGISQSALSSWETGHVPADWEKLQAVLPECKAPPRNSNSEGGKQK